METEDYLNDFLNKLDDLTKSFKINKELYLLWHSFFQDIEHSSTVRDFLMNQKEISIEEIKNTKFIFHEIMYRYIQRMTQEQDPDVLHIADTTANQLRLDDVAISLVELGKHQDKIMKLPTIEKLREDASAHEQA
ncbi:MAG TPA: hypothetical protein VL854_06755 [Nitrososphaeraceae archaeon]|nr:hypothetical protein [Nitrososphaeraceae archaeon]